MCVREGGRVLIVVHGGREGGERDRDRERWTGGGTDKEEVTQTLGLAFCFFASTNVVVVRCFGQHGGHRWVTSQVTHVASLAAVHFPYFEPCGCVDDYIAAYVSIAPSVVNEAWGSVAVVGGTVGLCDRGKGGRERMYVFLCVK